MSKLARPHLPLKGDAPGPSAAGWHSTEAAFRCEKEYQLGSVRGVIVPKPQLEDPLATGLGFHAGRARWFARGFKTTEKTWASIKEAVETELTAQKLPASLDAEQKALRLLQLYVDFWGRRPRPEVIAAEYEVGPAPLMKGSLFYRTARLDDVSRYPNGGTKLWLGESKTTSGGPADVMRQYELHGQTLQQALLWKMSPNGEAKHGPIGGVMLDIVKKPYDKSPPEFVRQPIVLDDFALAWYAKSVEDKMRRISQITWDSDVPRNPSACTRMVGRMRVDCPFKELCRFGRSSSIKYAFKDGESLLRKDRWEGTLPPWA